MGLGDIVT